LIPGWNRKSGEQIHSNRSAITGSILDARAPAQPCISSLSDNHGVRLSIKTINDEEQRPGSGAVLTKSMAISTSREAMLRSGSIEP